MKYINKIPSWLRNKYLLVSAGFLTWMLFFDEKDLMTQLARANELRQLEAGKAWYQQQISEASAELKLLESNPATIEKYAREKYLMKRAEEDLFVFPDLQGDTKN